MIVVLDANTIVGDAMFKSERWAQLADAVAEGSLRVIVPRIVVEEAKRNRIADRQDLARGLNKAANRASAEAKKHVRAAVDQCLTEARDYPDFLEKKLIALGFEIAPTVTVPHDQIAGRALARRRPFDESGNGYRDTLALAGFARAGRGRSARGLCPGLE